MKKTRMMAVMRLQYLLKSLLGFRGVNPHFFQLGVRGLTQNFHNFVRGFPLNFEVSGFFGVFSQRRFENLGQTPNH